MQAIFVFIHRSIKTRIETRDSGNIEQDADKFLYIDPLKQGLKLEVRNKLRKDSLSFYT